MATRLTIETLEALYRREGVPENNRRAVVTYSEDFTGRGLHWRIDLYGDGHWCRSDGYAGRVRTEGAANAMAERWIMEGQVGGCE